MKNTRKNSRPSKKLPGRGMKREPKSRPNSPKSNSIALRNLTRFAARQRKIALYLRVVQPDFQCHRPISDGSRVTCIGYAFLAFAYWTGPLREISARDVEFAILIQRDWLADHTVRTVELQTGILVCHFEGNVHAAPYSRGHPITSGRCFRAGNCRCRGFLGCCLRIAPAGTVLHDSGEEKRSH
jgi:hypothetical protein